MLDTSILIELDEKAQTAVYCHVSFLHALPALRHDNKTPGSDE